MNLIEWKDISDIFSVLFDRRPSITAWWCWMVPRNAPDHELVLTVPDPLNVLGNTTFVQRGSRQCWEGEQALLQLQPCRVWEMLSLPVWREIPTSKERHLYWKDHLAYSWDKREIFFLYWALQLGLEVQIKQTTHLKATDVTSMLKCTFSKELWTQTNFQLNDVINQG